MARPKAKIDMVELEKLCGMQCTDEEIAAFFGVSMRTIERRRKDKEVSGRHGARQSQGPGLGPPVSCSACAANGNIAAPIFLAKNLLGYKRCTSTTNTAGPTERPSKLVRAGIWRNLPMKNYSSFAPLLTRPFLRDEIDAEWPLAACASSCARLGTSSSRSTPVRPGLAYRRHRRASGGRHRGEIRNLLINVPPRHMKSLLVSVFWPAWEWIRWPGAAVAVQQLRGPAQHPRFD